MLKKMFCRLLKGVSFILLGFLLFSSCSQGILVESQGTLKSGNITSKAFDGITEYKIINVQSNKALDVSGPSTNNGANIHQWSYGGDTLFPGSRGLHPVFWGVRCDQLCPRRCVYVGSFYGAGVVFSLRRTSLYLAGGPPAIYWLHDPDQYRGCGDGKAVYQTG